MIRMCLVLTLAAGSAFSQPMPRPPELPPNCAPNRAGIVSMLQGNLSEGGFAEMQHAIWVDAKTGHMVELYGNPETGTSTILDSTPGGPTCIVNSGQGFQVFDPKPGDPA